MSFAIWKSFRMRLARSCMRALGRLEPWRGRARVLMGSVAHEEYTPAALTAVAHVLYAEALRFDTADEAHRFFELLDAVLGQADGEEVS